MRILEESYSIDTTEPGFVHIRHVCIDESYDRRGTVDMGGDMWFERTNLRWVVEKMRACLDTYPFHRTDIHSGQDHLIVFGSGDQQVFINLQNERPKSERHGGIYAPAFSEGVARRLVEDLAAIASARPAGGP